MLTILSFIFVMGIIVFVHELGHFISAKRSHIIVDEFGMGMPPRVMKLAERDGTVYSLNALPIGGFVRMRGEDDPTIPGSFAAASKKARALTLLAGALMNFALAIVLFASRTAIMGVPDTTRSGALIAAVAVGSPAEQAKLQPGDRIMLAGDTPVDSLQALQSHTQQHAGEAVTYTIARTVDGAETLVEVSMTPRKTPPEGQGALGIQIGEAMRRATVGEILWSGLQMTGQIIWLTFSLPVMLLTQGASVSELGFMGPVGIAATTGDVVRSAIATDTLLPVIWFTGLLSVAIGITNLLPIPGLDGGRLIFVLVEAIRGKRVEPAQEGFIHLMGIGVLLFLVGIVTIREVTSLVNGTFPGLGLP